MHTTPPDTAEARSLFKASPKDSHPLHFPSQLPQLLHLADDAIPAIPAARELAHALGLSLQHIPASGEGGRVSLLDVYHYASSNSATPQRSEMSTTPLDTHTFQQILQQWQVLAQQNAWSLDPFVLWVKLIWQGAYLSHQQHKQPTPHLALPRFWHIQQAQQQYRFDITQAPPTLRSLAQHLDLQPLATAQLPSQLNCQIEDLGPHATLYWSGHLASEACIARIVRLLQNPDTLWQLP